VAVSLAMISVFVVVILVFAASMIILLLAMVIFSMITIATHNLHTHTTKR
jgi:hypothetical protein